MKTIALLFTTIFFTAFTQAQEPLKQSQQGAQQTVIAFFEALSNRDSVSIKNYCTADILLLENGIVWTLDTLIKKAITLNQAADFKRSNAFDFINTVIQGNTAWVSYNLRSEVTKNGKQSSIHWLETVVLVKEEKKWKIKLLHSTLIKRD